MSQLYNVGAHGIPDHLQWEVKCWILNLKWSTHARAESAKLAMNLNLPTTSFDRKFLGARWELVELETDCIGRAGKVVVRRQVNFQWSIVLVILRDGPDTAVVKTCWANLNTDNHRTLDISKFSKP